MSRVSGSPRRCDTKNFVRSWWNSSIIGSIDVVFGDTHAAGLEVVRTILALHQDQPDNPLGGAPNPPVTVNSVTIEES